MHPYPPESREVEQVGTGRRRTGRFICQLLQTTQTLSAIIKGLEDTHSLNNCGQIDRRGARDVAAGGPPDGCHAEAGHHRRRGREAGAGRAAVVCHARCVGRSSSAAGAATAGIRPCRDGAVRTIRWTCCQRAGVCRRCGCRGTGAAAAAGTTAAEAGAPPASQSCRTLGGAAAGRGAAGGAAGAAVAADGADAGADAGADGRGAGNPCRCRGTGTCCSRRSGTR